MTIVGFTDLASLMYGFYRGVDNGNSALNQTQIDPGQIATAIESYGVCGFDDYGRFVESSQKGGERIKDDALKAVAATQAAYLKTDFEDTSVQFYIESFFEYDKSIRRYGWLESKLPTFEKRSSDIRQVPNRRGPRINTQTTLLKGLIDLAITNPDSKWTQTLEDLFVAAGFPDMNKKSVKNEKSEVSKLYEALGSNGNRDTLVNFLRQLGLLNP